MTKITAKLKNPNLPYFLILLSAMACIISYLKATSINGNDFWWHIKAGEWMVTNHKIPTHDMFSWLNQSYELKWTAHEWLSELVFYSVYHFLGTPGMMLFCTLTAMAFLTLVAYHIKGGVFKNFPATTVYFIALTALCITYFYGRPHVISYFLLFFSLKAVYDYVENKSSKSIFFMPLIAVLWANFHGGSSNLPYVIIIFAIITGVFNFKMGKVAFNRLPVRKLITLAAMVPATMLGLCINPYGLHMLKYPYENMADSTMLVLINEWAAPDAKQIPMLIFFFIPFALGIFVYMVTKEEISAFDLITYAFYSYLFLRSSRFIFFLAIASVFCMFKYIPKFGTLKPVTTKLEKSISVVLILIFVGFICVNVFNGIKKANSGELITCAIDDEFVQLIKDDAPKRPYTDYNYGAELIYNDVPVFVDGRADIYSGKLLDDCYNLLTFTPSFIGNEKLTPEYFENLLAKYDFDAFLLPMSRSLTYYLASHPEKYKLIKNDKETAYFKTITSD